MILGVHVRYQLCLNSNRISDGKVHTSEGGGGTASSGLYGEAPSERGAFLSSQYI